MSNVWIPRSLDEDLSQYDDAKHERHPHGIIFVNGKEVASTLQCPHCLTADASVLTQRGVLSIADVTTDDCVQDTAGQLVHVHATHRRSADDLYRISLRGGGEPLIASSEHPIWTINAKYDTKPLDFVPSSEPMFVPAGMVTPGMWVAVGDFVGEREAEDFCGVQMDVEFARFIGLYLAEGWVRRDGIEMAFHEDERDLIEFVVAFAKHRWGLVAHHGGRTNANGRRSRVHVVTLNSGKLDHPFAQAFSRGAENKRLPIEYLCYAPELQRALLEGLLDGDGHRLADRARRSLGTVSRSLAYQSFILMRRLGYHPSVTSAPARTSADGVHHQRSYAVSYSVPDDARRKYVGMRRHFQCAGKTWVKVRKVEPLVGAEDVFNLTTSSATFVANGTVTHNCGAHFVSRKGSGHRRTFCFKCKAVTCGAPQCDACRPFAAETGWSQNGVL